MNNYTREQISIARAISLWAPYPWFIREGLKQYETRSWTSHHRGPILIHCTQKAIPSESQIWLQNQLADLNIQFSLEEAAELKGQIVAIANLTGCLRMLIGGHPARPGQISISEQSSEELLLGDWNSMRYAWRLDNVTPIKQRVQARGRQGLWRPDADTVDRVCTALGAES